MDFQPSFIHRIEPDARDQVAEIVERYDAISYEEVSAISLMSIAISLSAMRAMMEQEWKR